MILYENLYIGDSLQKNKDKVIRTIKEGKVKAGLFCITLPSNQANLLEIYPYHELLKPYYEGKEINLIGIARTRQEAFDIVQTIIGSTYSKTGSFDVRNYLGYDL